MYQQLASKLFIATSGSEVSQPVSMEGFNSARAEVTLFTSSGTVTVQLQASNELENWTDVIQSPPNTGTGPIYKMFDAVTALSAAYIRIKWTANTAAAIIAGGINLSKL